MSDHVARTMIGWGSHESGDYKVLFGEPFESMPTNNGQLIVFSLP